MPEKQSDMKNLALFLFCLSLLAACRNTEQADSATDGTVQSADNSLLQSGNTGSFAPPISPGDSPTTNILTTQYWVMEYYVPFDNDYDKKMANKGRWYKFEKDGTFTCGQWQESHSNGSWRYGTSTFGNPTIVADALNDRLDAEWEFQFGNANTEMSWAGQQAFGVEGGAMVKAINLGSMPTKAQFGVE